MKGSRKHRRKTQFKKILENNKEDTKLVKGQDGLIYFHRLIYVPTKLRIEII